MAEKGIVLKSTGSWYIVQKEDNTLMECRMTGKFRLDGLPTTNPIAVGDQVSIVPDNEIGKGVIKEIYSRKNYVVRQSPRNKHEVHLLASNVDQAVVVITMVQPKLKQGFIDRFLLMTEPYNISTLIVFNKADLYREADMEIFHNLREMYEKIGYDCLLLSATTGHGIEILSEKLKNKISLIGGQSGVGKSSLLNKLDPAHQRKTGIISDYSGKGQHTTTFAEMFPYTFGGYIIDTPGIKTLGFNYLSLEEVAHNFREFFELSKQCRFGGKCLHRNEPNCAVKEGLEKTLVSELRYQNYLQILSEVEEQNYWERQKGY
jgi:ribosome biogenesis GTPase